MRGPIVAAIVRKDARAFTRDRFFFFITILALVAYAVVYFFIPSNVDETVTVGVHQTGLDELIRGVAASSRGLAVAEYDSSADLEDAVTRGADGVVAGLDFPTDFAETVAAGERARVRLLLPAGVSEDDRLLLEGIVGEVAFAVAGVPPPVDPITDAVVLGTDRVGDQMSLQDQMRPMLLFFVLMVETFALASLVSIEIQERTVTAVLATPARIGDVLAAKGIFGTGLAFVEVLFLALVIGALAPNLPLMLVALLLGSILVTGFGMIAGSFGRDFMEVLFISFAFMIPLAIPAMAALFPGTAPLWVRLIPSFGLVDVIGGVTTDGESWREVSGALASLAAWSTAAFVAGSMILKRRVSTL